jgi:hypothetical protein
VTAVTYKIFRKPADGLIFARQGHLPPFPATMEPQEKAKLLEIPANLVEKLFTSSCGSLQGSRTGC